MVLYLGRIGDANGNEERNESNDDEDVHVFSESDSDLGLIKCQNCGGMSCWWSVYVQEIVQETESKKSETLLLLPHNRRTIAYIHFLKLGFDFIIGIVPECVTKIIIERLFDDDGNENVNK